MSEYSIRDLVADHLCYIREETNEDYYFVLPLQEINQEIKGSKIDMTRDEHVMLIDHGYVESSDERYSWICNFADCDSMELHLGCIDENLCVVVIYKKEDEICELPSIFHQIPYIVNEDRLHFYIFLKDIQKNVLLTKIKNLKNCFDRFHGDLMTQYIWEKPDAIFHQYNENSGIPEVSFHEMKKMIKQIMLYRRFVST